MTRALTTALTLSLLFALPALAGEWLVGERGDNWTYTGRVTPARVTSRVTQFQPERSASIRGSSGGWRLWDDFAGLGALWLHAEQRGRIFVWSEGQAQLLADLDEAPGYGSLKVVRLARSQLEVWIAPTEETIVTPAGTFTCRVLQVTMDPNGPRQARRGFRLYLARGAGLVRYVESLNPYDYGIYYERVEIVHDREPATPGFRTLAIRGATNGVRVGNRALIAAGDRVEVVDLAAGRIERTFRVPANTIEVSGRDALVSGSVSGVAVTHRLNLERLSLTRIHSVRGRAIPVSDGTGAWRSPVRRIVDVVGTQLRILDDAGRLEHELTLGMIGYGNYGYSTRWNTLILPMAYPGGVSFVDLESGTADRINVRDWIHDVKPLRDKIFVAGDFDGLAYVPWARRWDKGEIATVPVLSGRVGRLHVDGDRLYTISDRGLAIVSHTGQLEKTVALPGVSSSAMSLSQHSILDVQQGRALILVANEGLRLVDLR